MPALTSLSTNKASPKWTFRGRPQSAGATANGTPGPGTYTTPTSETKFGKARRCHFGSAPRERPQSAGASPGPGQYTPATTTHQKQSPRFGFGASVRGGGNHYQTPGPGSYECKTTIGKATPHYSMRMKSGQDRNSHGNPSPGPGAYTPADPNVAYSGCSRGVGSRKPQWSFGTSTRHGSDMKPTPGPGAYEQKVAGQNAPAYSMRERRMEKKWQSSTPGPGAYGDNFTQFT